MDELKRNISKNMIHLRSTHHMTQLQLGEQISYSDKAISKWERAEATPDIYVLKQLADFFQVSVDYMISAHNELPEKKETPSPESTDKKQHLLISLISFSGVWAAALLLFIICWAVDIPAWQIFIYAIPASLTVLLVFNSLWGKPKRNFLILSLLIAGVLLTIYVALLPFHLWMLFFLIIPAEIILLLCCKLSHIF